MDYLPKAVTLWLEGRIDPTSQRLVERYSQNFFIILVFIAFAVSFALSSILIGLEFFMGGFILLLLAAVPPWPYLNRYPVKYLPARTNPPISAAKQ